VNLRYVAVSVLLMSGAGPPGGQAKTTLTMTPARARVDEVVAIRAGGLGSSEHVLLHAELTDGTGSQWAAEAEYVANGQGLVDTSTMAPIKGSYMGVSAMGLVWSMKPDRARVAAYQSPRDFAPQQVEFRLRRNGHDDAAASLEQLAIGDGVRQVRLEAPLHGILFVPASSGPHPGVLVVGGSEGGVPREKAAWLASHGYAALALAYFRFDNLPSNLEAIPLEYFGRALAWMAARPEIAADRLAVVGTSRGGELALQLGSMYPEIHAVVAYVPANLRYPACCGSTGVPYAWTWQGQPLAFVPAISLRRGSAPMQPIAEIEVERTHGPICLISGDDDAVWSSSAMAAAIVRRLKSKRFTFAVEHWSYPRAGHRAGRPEIVPAWHGVMIHPVSGRAMDLGGTAAGDAASSIDAIPRVLAFLQRSLER
jgi:dienelactone hydrolase